MNEIKKRGDTARHIISGKDREIMILKQRLLESNPHGSSMSGQIDSGLRKDAYESSSSSMDRSAVTSTPTKAQNNLERSENEESEQADKLENSKDVSEVGISKSVRLFTITISCIAQDMIESNKQKESLNHSEPLKRQSSNLEAQLRSKIKHMQAEVMLVL